MRRPEDIKNVFVGGPGRQARGLPSRKAVGGALSKTQYGILLLACFAFEIIWAAEGGADEKIPPLRPAKAIIPPSFWEQYAGWVIAGVSVLLLLLGMLVWWLAQPKPPVPIPPAVQAHQALRVLLQTAETGIVLSKVSHIVRTYFGVAFGLPPGEHTTTEFSRAISAREDVSAELKEDVNGFLRLCDDRKFAPSPPSAPIGAVARAEELIERAEARRLELEKGARQEAKTEPAVPRQAGESGAGAKT